MPLILGVSEPLSLEDVAQMPPTVIAYYLRPHHTQTGVRLLTNGVRECVPEGRPSTPRVEFVIGFV